MKRNALILLTAGLATLLPGEALACAVCFGKSDSPMAYGMNAGIFVLLAVIGTLLALITSFFVFICRRAAQSQVDDPTPPTV